MENEKLNWVAPQIITVKPEQTEAGTYPVSAGEGVHNIATLHYTGS